MRREDELDHLRRQLDRALKDFNAMQKRPSKKQPAPLHALIQQLPAIARRAFSPGPTPDGIAGGSLGGGRGGGPKIKVRNEEGQDELVDVTSVEATMFALLARERSPASFEDEHDPIGVLGERVARLFIVAVAALKQARVAATDFYSVENDAPIDSPLACELCIEAGLPTPRTWETVGDVGGRLPKKLHLCTPCRTFIEQKGEPPSIEQRLQYDQTGRWKVRTAGRVRLVEGFRQVTGR